MFDLQQRWYGIENLDKDGSLHEQNVFAQVTFGEFSSFVWTCEQILYGKVTLVKIHWQILFNKFLCSVWTQILCYSFFDKYSLPKKHCSWELSLSFLPVGPILNWKLHTLWLLNTINSFAPDVVVPNKLELQSWPWQTKFILITTVLAAACMVLKCTIYMYKIMLQMSMALRYASTAKSEHYDWKTVGNF